MTLFDRTRIFSLTVLLAPLALVSCSDDSSSDGTPTETETGDGDPGDGDPGDGDPGDGDPGDGDPGDGDPGDGDPGDGDPGDGDPGDGDPGDGDPGDGDPGSCDPMDAAEGLELCLDPRGWFWNGEVCQQITCECEGRDCDALFVNEEACLAEYGECLAVPPGDCDPFDAAGVGFCDAFFGYAWTGNACVGLSGCECEGADCDKLYDDPEHCWDNHALCELDDPCAPDDALGVGPCAQFFGVAWNGNACVGISGCECEGSDCDSLANSLDECELAHAECSDPDPDGCAALDEDACLGTFECMPLSGSLLTEANDGMCLMAPDYIACTDPQVCPLVITWGCGPTGEVAEFPSGCLPDGWEVCAPPIVEPGPCE